MNADYQKQLEAAIDRELKALPPLEAPAALAPRVLAAIGRRAWVPWYRQPWQSWPAPLQAAALLVLVSALGGLCFAGSELGHTEPIIGAMKWLGGWFAGVRAIWTTLGALAGAAVTLGKGLGTGFLIGILAAIAFGYVMLLSLGTLYVRLAFARR